MFGKVVDKESICSCLFIQKRLKFDVRSFLIIFYAFCQGHDKVANLLTYASLELKWLTIKKETYFLYKIPDKPTSNRTTLVRVVAIDVYLDKI